VTCCKIDTAPPDINNLPFDSSDAPDPTRMKRRAEREEPTARASNIEARSPTPAMKERTDRELLTFAHAATETAMPPDHRVEAHLAKKLAPDPRRMHARRLTLLLSVPYCAIDSAFTRAKPRKLKQDARWQTPKTDVLWQLRAWRRPRQLAAEFKRTNDRTLIALETCAKSSELKACNRPSPARIDSDEPTCR
jgi:hypothetical protein